MRSELSKRYTAVKQFSVLVIFHLFSAYALASNLSSGSLQPNQVHPTLNPLSRPSLELYLKKNNLKLENSKKDLDSKNEFRKSLSQEFKLELKNIHMGPGAGGGGNSCEILVQTTLIDLLNSLNELSASPIMNDLRTKILNIQEHIQFDIKDLNTEANNYQDVSSSDPNAQDDFESNEMHLTKKTLVNNNNYNNWTDAINIPELDLIILDNEICNPLLSKTLREANLLHELSSLLGIEDSNNKFEVTKLFLFVVYGTYIF